jgi:ergothioneine biosynthesis protein EgtB
MNMQTEAQFWQPATNLAQHYANVRSHSMNLCEPLSAEDCSAQSMPDASPIKWHLAHTTWFFETFILEQFERNFQAFNPAFRILFNSYYNGIGAKHPRPQRGLLTRPPLQQVFDYRRNVDARILSLLEDRTTVNEIATLVELGLHHEQQHQELMLTDIKHLLFQNPLQLAYIEQPAPNQPAMPPLEWLDYDAGIVEIGHDGDGFCFDNEEPRHRQFIEPFKLATRLVSNGEYLAFITAGGYANAALWLSEGWDWVQSNQISQPLYWCRAGQGDYEKWQEFTLHGVQPLDLSRPVTHLSYFEADAYARWIDARLPTEAEWERAASEHAGCAAECTTGVLHPQAASQHGLAQLFGACWQWTSSSYAPYPGYATAKGAIGEYNGKFMVNQYVLRGSSCATPGGHSRATYRNFFPASARWQFSGIRLARS